MMNRNHRVFDWDSQKRFAHACCDFNPIHLDPVAARRTQSGGPIVHGIHSLLWILDCAAASKLTGHNSVHLKVHFRQPTYVGDAAVAEISQPSPSLLRCRMLVDGEEVVMVTCGFNELPPSDLTLGHNDACLPPPKQPSLLSLTEMAGLTGCLSLPPELEQLDAMFPNAVRAFGHRCIAALGYSSCLVGMVVPGLHSMYTGLEAWLNQENSSSINALSYAVESVVERFRLVRIAIQAPGLRGSVETVSRMPPARQPDMQAAESVVSTDEFRGCTSLIIGGSRGLGELTAKIIAAGGGHPIITYVAGKAEAGALVDELTTAGAECTAMAYDVRRPAAEQLENLAIAPTQIYYFATPPIFRRKSGIFDERRLAEFNSFYIIGFFDLIQHCRRLGAKDLRVFYPSSAALDERPAMMTEYSMAKAAAEVLCADISRFLPDVNILVRRLPRLPTDQTNTVVPSQAIDAINIMLPIVREMNMGFGAAAQTSPRRW